MTDLVFELSPIIGNINQPAMLCMKRNYKNFALNGKIL